MNIYWRTENINLVNSKCLDYSPATEEGKYTLTVFGRIIYDIALAAMENAVNNYWKLKAIESLRTSKDLPVVERKKIIDSFIDNQQIKDILVRDDNMSDSQPYAGALQQQQQHSYQTLQMR
jgi:hypothetical protein